LTTPFVIALDAMGGDKAPQSVLSGAAMAIERHPGIQYLLFGDEERLKPMLAKLPKLAACAEIRHTAAVVSPSEKPSQALRRGRDSSMRRAIDAVAAGEAVGVVSGGNTGALMAMSKFVLHTLPGIDRPAIAGIFPTINGEAVVLDLGANIECDANNLVQFAVMGAAFARSVLGLPNPTVGLLNVGEEELKGNDTVRLAAQILRGTPLPLEFIGFIEGDDITKGTSDVVVTDGFTGNIALRSAEGSAKLCFQFLRQAFGQSLLARLGYLLARAELNRMRQRLNPQNYNGGVFLGLNGISVKSHGGSDAHGFAAAVGVAAAMAKDQLKQRIIEDVKRFGGVAESPSQAAAQ
jgi:glycerol-3-phosphate acyltransferase PlsX